MTNPNEKEWWKERCDGVFRGDQFDLVQDMMEESRSRFKEEVIRALQDKQTCEADNGNYCGACAVSGSESDHCYNGVFQEAIETIKKL